MAELSTGKTRKIQYGLTSSRQIVSDSPEWQQTFILLLHPGTKDHSLVEKVSETLGINAFAYDYWPPFVLSL